MSRLLALSGVIVTALLGKEKAAGVFERPMRRRPGFARLPLAPRRIRRIVEVEAKSSMTDQDDYRRKTVQCTTWLRDWVKSLPGPITVDPSEMFEWKICSGDPPLLLDVLRISATNYVAPENTRRRSLWTQLKNILARHDVETTQMGIAYPEIEQERTR